MVKIIFYYDESHLYSPNDDVSGCVKFDSPFRIKSLQLYLTGTIHVASPWVGNPRGGSHDLIFISELKAIPHTQTTFHAGHAYPFSFRLPARVRWDIVKWNQGLGIADPSSIPDGLPPSFSDFASTVSVKYELRAEAWAADDTVNSRVRSRAVTSLSSPPYEILLRGGREVDEPSFHPITFIEQFCARSHKLDQRPGHERSLSARLSDLVHDKEPPFFPFELHFSTPQAVIAGQKLPVKVTLLADDTVSTGANAPDVVLNSFKAIFQTYTHIQIPTRPGPLKEDDTNVYIRDCHVAPLNRPILLTAGVETELDDYIHNLGMSLEDVPSFETFGIQRTFTMTIVGSVLVAGKTWRFSRKHELRVLSAAYEPAPDYEPASYIRAPIEDDAPPPYRESVSGATLE